MRLEQRFERTGSVCWVLCLVLLAQSNAVHAGEGPNRELPAQHGRVERIRRARLLAERSVEKLQSYDKQLKNILGYLPTYQKKLRRKSRKKRKKGDGNEGDLEELLRSYRNYIGKAKKQMRRGSGKGEYRKRKSKASRKSKRKTKRSRSGKSGEGGDDEDSVDINFGDLDLKGGDSLDQQMKDILGKEGEDSSGSSKPTDEDEDSEDSGTEESDEASESSENIGAGSDASEKEMTDKDEDASESESESLDMGGDIGDDESESEEDDDEDEQKEEKTDDEINQFLNELQEQNKISESNSEEMGSSVSETEKQLDNMLTSSSSDSKSGTNGSESSGSSIEAESGKKSTKFNFSSDSDSESNSFSFKLEPLVPEPSTKSEEDSSSSSISIKLNGGQTGSPKIDNSLQKLLLQRIQKLEEQISCIKSRLQMFYVYGNEPLFKTFGDRSLDQLSMTAGSVSRPVLLYFAPQTKLLHFGRPAFDYIYETIDRFQQPHYASFRIGFDQRSFEQNRKLFPTKNYFGHSFLSALKTLDEKHTGDMVIRERKMRIWPKKGENKMENQRTKWKKKNDKFLGDFNMNSRRSGVHGILGKHLH